MRLCLAIFILLAGCRSMEKKTEVPVPETRNITIAFTGDLMFHRSVYRSAWDNDIDSYDFMPMFQSIQGIVDSADIAVANFETVLAGPEVPYAGYPRFNTPDHILDAIDSCGFDILQTANNHCLDQGIEALNRTIEKIREQGLLNCGTFTGQDSLRCTIIEENGIRMGFYAFTYGTNGMRKQIPHDTALRHINYIDDPELEANIRRARTICDFLIVLPHWGNEYEIHSSNEQRNLAAKMVEWGADLIVGTHPHVVQEMAYIGDVPVFYSLGNCLSSQLERHTDRIHTQYGVILEVTLEKKEEVAISAIGYIPLWMHAYYDDAGIQYEVLPIDDALNRNPHRFDNAEKQKMLKSRFFLDERFSALRK